MDMERKNNIKSKENDTETANKVRRYNADVLCGYGDCKPAWIQTCNNPKILLAVMMIFSLTDGFIIHGVNKLNTQSYERRFGLTSADAGVIASVHELAGAIFSIILAFIGSGRYKGRWLAAGSISASLGCIVTALPHYTTGLYDWGQQTGIPVCVVNNTLTEECVDTSLRHYLWVFIGGMCLLGLGSAIQYSIGVGFIDESVPSIRVPLYIGILYGTMIFGPGLGFIFGGYFLSMYVDFDTVNIDEVPLDDKDPRWVGAWWLPFFIAAAMYLLAVLPLSMFGAELPTAESIRKTRESQTHRPASKKVVSARGGQNPPITSILNTTWSLLKNAPFTCLVLSDVFWTFNITGITTFLQKYFQNKFNRSPLDAAIFMGLTTIPGGATGTFLGGFICNRMRLKVRGMIRFGIIAALVTIAFVACFWISCEKAPLAGINTAYDHSGGLTKTTVDHGCNENCGCKTEYYRPVCAEDKLQYFSACHAGCTRFNNETEVFNNCTCLGLADDIQGSSVNTGVCDSDCKNVYTFSVVLFCFSLSAFLVNIPTDAAILRCTDDSQRTYSMGLKEFIVRLLGAAPGPVVYGLVTDSSCLVWQNICGDDTSCWIDNQDHVSRNYFLLCGSMCVIAVVFKSLALYLYVPPSDEAIVKEIVIKPPNEETIGNEITHF